MWRHISGLRHRMERGTPGRSVKTKGALVWDFNQPWSVEEIVIGEPRKGEVKVRMEAAGLCQSDHRVVSGDIPMAAFPMLGGHEGAGVVVEVGDGVEGLSVGDHVAVVRSVVRHLPVLPRG
jgi:S-(hydroxymethyl)glutathione dehydrogenase/alcohol dehydrogenase